MSDHVRRKCLVSQELDSGPCEHMTIASSIGALELEPGKRSETYEKND